MKLCILVNPYSGAFLQQDWRGALTSLAASGEHEVSLRFVGEQSLEEALSREELSQMDLIIVGGGDGTISSVVPYLIGSEVPLLILPLGTANDLARELGIPSPTLNSFDSWLKAGLQGHNEQLTVWRVSFGNREGLFINYLSIGFDGEVVKFFDSARDTLRWITRWTGSIFNKVLYGIGGLWHLRGNPLSGIDASGKRSSIAQIRYQISRARTLFFSNIGSVMGIARSHPDASPFDRVIELTVIPSVLSYLGIVSRLSPWRPEFREGAESWKLAGLPRQCLLQLDGETLSYESSEGELFINCGGSVMVRLPKGVVE